MDLSIRGFPGCGDVLVGEVLPRSYETLGCGGGFLRRVK
jgi:hypothetical protein